MTRRERLAMYRAKSRERETPEDAERRRAKQREANARYKARWPGLMRERGKKWQSLSVTS